MAARLAEITPEQDAAAIRSRVVCLQTLDPEVYTPAVSGRSGEDFDPDAALRAIECPVLLLQADPERGSALRYGDAARAAAALRDCSLVKFDGAGHGIHRGDPTRFRRVLFDFLDTV
jgi:pimeloyl-ACP methyl ester carboxylesterase